MVLPHYPRKIKYLQNNPKKDKFLYNQSKNLCSTILQNMTEDWNYKNLYIPHNLKKIINKTSSSFSFFLDN